MQGKTFLFFVLEKDSVLFWELDFFCTGLLELNQGILRKSHIHFLDDHTAKQFTWKALLLVWQISSCSWMLEFCFLLFEIHRNLSVIAEQWCILKLMNLFFLLNFFKHEVSYFVFYQNLDVLWMLFPSMFENGCHCSVVWKDGLKNDCHLTLAIFVWAYGFDCYFPVSI